jgi:hypothetical protein
MPAHPVQTSLARIAVIMGGILEDIYAVNSVGIHTYEVYAQKLEIWLSTLPQAFGGEARPEMSRGDWMAMVGMSPLIRGKC